MGYEKLEQVLRDRGISKCALAMKCGIPPSALYNALNGKIVIWPKYKKSISDYLGMTEEELFEKKHSLWISCSEKLPKLSNDVTEGGKYKEVDLWLESDPVLVYSDESKRIYTAILSAYDSLEEKNWINTENLDTIQCITHWMPLPNPPEEV